MRHGIQHTGIEMRPITAVQRAKISVIASHFPAPHHTPEERSTADLARLHFDDAAEFCMSETPVFVAGKVTPRAAVMPWMPPVATSHAPGYMFVTNPPNSLGRV